MTTGLHGKVQRSVWVTPVAAEKIARLSRARGGRSSAQVVEEAVHLLYLQSPLMHGLDPIPGDPFQPLGGAVPPPPPRTEMDELLDAAAERLGPQDATPSPPLPPPPPPARAAPPAAPRKKGL